MSEPSPIIALLTDFGSSSPYVGILKGVIASRCPQAQVIDITHDVTPQELVEGAYLLRMAYRHFPAHTIFLAVVDPGVGTDRRGVAVHTPHGIFVGPDNGLLWPTLEHAGKWRAVALYRPDGPISDTFHGRDWFAPVAAALASGRGLGEFGLPTQTLEPLEAFKPLRTAPNALEGEVLYIDSFGNIITSIGPFVWEDDHLLLSFEDQYIALDPESAQIRVGQEHLTGVVRTYGEAEPGDLIALISSDQQLEIALNQDDAATALDVALGDVVQFEYRPLRRR